MKLVGFDYFDLVLVFLGEEEGEVLFNTSLSIMYATNRPVYFRLDCFAPARCVFWSVHRAGTAAPQSDWENRVSIYSFCHNSDPSSILSASYANATERVDFRCVPPVPVHHRWPGKQSYFWAMRPK